MSEVRDYSALLSGYTLNAKARTLATGAPVFVTYSFPTTVTDEVKLTDPGAAYTWAAFNSAEITFARAALKAWGDASGITFIETKVGKGDITFNWLDFDLVGASDAAAYAYYPDIAGGLDGSLSVHPVGSDVFLSRDLRNTDFQDRDYLMHVLLHEIGHAIGLKHPFEASDYNSKTLAASLDDTRHTVMSYNGEDSSLGPFDLQAVAAMYGSNANDASNIASWSWNDTAQTLTQVGRSADDYILGISAIDIIDGKEGIDTIHGLGGADRIDGGSGNDKIYGDDGNDVLNGGLGGDKLFGGAGDDIFSVPTGRDTLDGGAGIDTLDLSTLTKGIDFYYATLKFGSEVVKVNYVEKIIGGSGNDKIQAYYLLDSDYTFMGGAGDDVLCGGQGRDRLDGGTGFDIAFLGGALGATVDLAIRGPRNWGRIPVRSSPETTTHSSISRA
ncbi:hypothetical protein D3874_16020 [Oleomonas cavernae]|uniref:Peptidase metallopeptidase domain-containing protein n=1 Tax=Oleomonas cavernae TaxID=2320859 RepID=A0A418WEC2_9PROT|nr:matrixin family metalloprotease [Oleomonas cavernae]RJF88334.1 hypothetical protein D3874_16020 [Oleomonas cavernae]